MARGMSKKDLAHWRERLRYAKDHAAAMGLLDTSDYSPMRCLIDLYRGDQWRHVSRKWGLDSDQLRTVNKIFPMANAQQGSIIARNPKIRIRARKRESLANVHAVEQLVKYDIEEQDFLRQFQAAFRYHQFAPYGIIRHGFTPQKEFFDDDGNDLFRYRPAKPDRPWMRAMKPWDVLLDPNCDQFHPDAGMDWCAFRDVMQIEDIRKNPNMINREDLKDFAGSVSPEWRELGPEELRDAKEKDPDKENDVEIWTIYEARGRTWMQITLDDNLEKPLREPAPWPIPWETLPINVFAVNEQMDMPFPVPLLEQAIPIQEDINVLYTMSRQLIHRLRRLVGISEGAMDDIEFQKLQDGDLVEFFKVKGDLASVIKQIQIGGMPQEFLAWREVLAEDLRESIGQSKMSRGQRINVQSATEAANVQQGDNVSAGRILSIFERFMEETISTYMQGRRATIELTGPEIVQIVGAANAEDVQEFAEVDASMIAGDYSYRVEIGSTRQRDRDLEAQQAAVDLEMALRNPQLMNVAYFAFMYAEARKHDPSQALTDQAFQAAKIKGAAAVVADVQNAAGGGGNGAAGPSAQGLSLLPQQTTSVEPTQ